MEKEKPISETDSYAKPMPTSAEATLGTPILQVSGPGTLEDVSSPRAMLIRALDEYRQNNFESAASILVKLIKMLKRLKSRASETPDPEEGMLTFASAATTLGRSYMHLGRHEEAQSSFAEAADSFRELMPPGKTMSAQSHSDYGIALFMVGRTDEAIAHLQQAHALGSKSAETYIYLGVSLKQRQQYQEAEKCLEEAIEAAPGEALAHEELAKVMEFQGPARFAEAAQSYYAAAFLLASGGQFERSLEILDHALSLHPNNGRMLVMKAEILRMIGRNEEAIEVADQALQVDITAAEQLYTVKAGALQSLARFEEALAEADKALSQNPSNATALGLKGQALHAQGKNQEAIQFLKRSIELEPDMDWTQAELAAIDFDLSNYDEALSRVDIALGLNPDNVWALYIKGETLRTQKQFQPALELFDQALLLRPNNPTLLITKAEALRQLQRYEEALQTIDQALESSPTAYALGTKGQILYALNRIEEATATLQQAVEMDPKQNWVHAELGIIAFENGKADEALAAFDKALELSPNDPRTLTAKAEALASQNRHEEAIVLLRRSIEIDPGLTISYSQLTNSLLETGQDAEALEVIERGANAALEENPNDSTIMVIKGQVLIAVGRYDEAIEVLQRALTIKPDLDEAHAELGGIFVDTAEFERAMPELEEALRLNDGNAVALTHKARVLMVQGQLDEATTLLRRSAELDNENDVTYIALAETLRRATDYAEALEAVDKGLTLNPQNAEGFAIKAEVLHALNRNEEAVKSCEEALALNPRFKRARFELASVLFDLGRPEEAQTAIDKALESGPDADSLGLKADILRVRGMFPEAEQTIEEALKFQPDDPWLLSIKGQILNGLDKFDEALACLDLVLSKQPENVVALRSKGIALFALSRAAEAIEMFEQALKIEPENTNVITTAAFSLLFDDEYNEEELNKALSYLEDALKIDPDYGWAWSIKGTTLCDLAEYSESIQALNQAIKLDDSDIDSRTYLGWALQCQASGLMKDTWAQRVKDGEIPDSFADWASKCKADGLLRDSESAYRAALALDPENLWSLKGIANLRYLLGDSTEAAKIYQQVLEKAQLSGDLDPDTLSLMGWCQYRLRQFDEAVRLFTDNQSLIAGMTAAQFDLALALLCGKQYSPGLGQYEKTVALSEDRPARRRRGLLIVAHGDLVEAIIADKSMWSAPEVRNALSQLEDALPPRAIVTTP